MMGAERKSMIMKDEEKLLTAYHEAGHAITGSLNSGEGAFYGPKIPRALFTDKTIEKLDQYLIEYEKGKLDGVSSESFLKNARLENRMDASLAELHRDFVKLGGGFEIIEERNSYRKQLIVKIPLADNYEEFLK